VTVEDLIAEGDKVVCRNVVTGTHQGEYLGLPPTGRPVTYNEIFIFRFEGGRIAETWGVVDLLAQLRQLGAVSRTARMSTAGRSAGAGRRRIPCTTCARPCAPRSSRR
jgi:SnoaL-like polyketide cyclase